MICADRRLPARGCLYEGPVSGRCAMSSLTFGCLDPRNDADCQIWRQVSVEHHSFICARAPNTNRC